MTRCAGALAAVGLLVSVACGGGEPEGAPSTTVAPTTVVASAGTVAEVGEPAWAAEAQAWYDGLTAAQIAEGGTAFARFAAPDLVAEDRPVYAGAAGNVWVGTDAVEAAAVLLGPESLRMDPEIFVSVDGLVLSALYDWAPLGNDYRPDTKEPAHLVCLMMPIGSLGYGSWICGRSAEDWGERRSELPEVDDAEAIATSWTRVWSGADGDVPSLYDGHVRLRDTIAGVDVSGRDAVAERAGVSGRWEITTVDPDDVRGVYAFIWRREGVRVLEEVVLVVSGHDATGCSGEMVVWLSLDEGLVVDEQRYWPIERARRCLAAVDLPDGWWTGREVPQPPPRPFEDLDTATDPVVVGDVTIAVYNGTSALNGLVVWALSRFEAAGLALPEIESVTFTRYSIVCDEAWAQHQATEEGSELTVCFDDDGFCTDDTCVEFTADGRMTILHELAHAWMHAALDDSAEQRFIDHLGLEVWNDPLVAWDQRAGEHAAETIAWGLMDREMPMPRIGDPSPDELATNFGILTGIDPLPRTDALTD